MHINIKKYFDLLRKNSLINESAVFFSLQMLGRIFAFINVWLVDKYFGLEAQGILSMFFSYIAIITAVVILGLDISTLRVVSENIGKRNLAKAKEFLLKSYSIVIVFGVVISVVLYFLSPFIANTMGHPEYYLSFRVISFIIIPIVILQLNSEFILAFSKNIIYAILKFFIPIFSFLFLLIIIFHVKKFNLETPFLIHTGSSLVMFVISLVIVMAIVLRIKQPHSKFWTRKQIIQFSLPMFNMKMVRIFMSWIDIFVIGIFCTPYELGIYIVVKRIAEIANLPSSAIYTPIKSKLSKLFYQDRKEELRQLMNKSTILCAITTALSLILILLFYKKIFNLFNGEIIQGFSSLIVLLFLSLFQAITGPIGLLFIMTGNEKLNQKLANYNVLVLVILVFILVPIYGIVGAAIAIAIPAVIRKIIALIYLRKKYSLTLYK